jgi:hypothetical protein
MLAGQDEFGFTARLRVRSLAGVHQRRLGEARVYEVVGEIRRFFARKLVCAMPGILTSCLSGFGSGAKNLASSRNDVIPSHCLKMTR